MRAGRKTQFFAAAWLLLLCNGACTATREQAEGARAKVELNLGALDADGLRGPRDGKVAVAYEFCIPKTAACRAEVKRIDPSVQFSSSPGRIGAGKDQYLCIGSTHQPNFAEVLHRLAALDYVERIIECPFE